MNTKRFDNLSTLRMRLTAILLVVITLVMGATLIAPRKAAADVNPNDWADTYMNLGVSASPTQASQYDALLRSIQAASGHNFRDGVSTTQWPANGLIRVQLSFEGQSVRLWLQPNNLYVVGYETSDGHVFSFADAPALQDTMRTMGDHHGGSLLQYGYVQSLNFASDYNSLVRAAGRGRESMPVSYRDVIYSVQNLAGATNPYGGNQQAVARSLMLLVQYTSEAVRFNDVFGVMRDVTANPTSYYGGLPMLQQRLENSWGAISDYAFSVSNNSTTAPRTIVGVGTLSSWNDVRRYMRTLLANPPTDSGDWNHSEL